MRQPSCQGQSPASGRSRGTLLRHSHRRGRHTALQSSPQHAPRPAGAQPARAWKALLERFSRLRRRKKGLAAQEEGSVPFSRLALRSLQQARHIGSLIESGWAPRSTAQHSTAWQEPAWRSMVHGKEGHTASAGAGRARSSFLQDQGASEGKGRIVAGQGFRQSPAELVMGGVQPHQPRVTEPAGRQRPR